MIEALPRTLDAPPAGDEIVCHLVYAGGTLCGAPPTDDAHDGLPSDHETCSGCGRPLCVDCLVLSEAGWYAEHGA